MYRNIEFSENARLLMEQAEVSAQTVETLVTQSEDNGEVAHLDGTGVADIFIGGQPIRVVLSETPVVGQGGAWDASVIATKVLP